MDAMRSYVIHLCATALICSVIQHFARGSGPIKMMVKLLCGIVLAYSLIHPIKKLKLNSVENFALTFQEEAERAVQSGKELSSEAWTESITQRIEAYIWEKAKAMDLDLVVEVKLSNDAIPVPVGVTLTGNVAPYAKKVLSDEIARDLDIPKEKQAWILQ